MHCDFIVKLKTHKVHFITCIANVVQVHDFVNQMYELVSNGTNFKNIKTFSLWKEYFLLQRVREFVLNQCKYNFFFEKHFIKCL